MTENRSFRLDLSSEGLTFNEEYFARTPDEILLDRGSRIESELEELNNYVRVLSNLKDQVITPIQDIILTKGGESPGMRCVKRICSHLIVIEGMVTKFYNYSNQYFSDPRCDEERKTFKNSASCLNTIIKAWQEYLVAYAEADAFEAFEEVAKLRDTRVIINSGYEEFTDMCNAVSFEVSGPKNGRNYRIFALKLSCLLMLTHEERASIVVLSNEFLVSSLDTNTEVEQAEFVLICDKLARLTERNRLLQNQVNVTRKFWVENPKLLNCLEVKDSKKLIILSSKDRKLTYLKWSSHSIGFALFPDSLLKYTIDFLGCYEAQVLPLRLLWVYAGKSRPESRLQMQIIAPEVQLVLLCGNEEDRDYWVRAINEATIDHIGALRQESNIRSIEQSSSLLWPPQIRNGTYIFTAGNYQSAKYTGQWLEGKPHGKGKMYWTDGKSFEGSFRKGLFHGKGRYIVPQTTGKDVYEGQFEEGLYHGYAVLSYGNGDRYEGEWLKGNRHGHGKFYLTQDNNYSVYTGEWANGKRFGFGIENSTEAEKSYHGMWRDDVREGQGFTITTRDEYCACRFKDNTLSGRGFIINGKGKSYEGWLSGLMGLNGTGELKLPDSTVISGTFSGKWNEWVHMGAELKITNAFISRNPKAKKSTTFTDIDWEEKALKYAPDSDVKWCSLFEKCKKVLHLVGKEPSSPIRGSRSESRHHKRSIPDSYQRSHSVRTNNRTYSVGDHRMKIRPYATYSELSADGIVDANRNSFDISLGPVCMPPPHSTPVEPGTENEKRKGLILDLRDENKQRERSSSNPEPYSSTPSMTPDNAKFLNRRSSQVVDLQEFPKISSKTPSTFSNRSSPSSNRNSPSSDRNSSYPIKNTQFANENSPSSNRNSPSSNTNSPLPNRKSPDLESTLTSYNKTSTYSTTPNASPSLYNSQHSTSLETSSILTSPLERAPAEDVSNSLDCSDFTNSELAIQKIKKNLFDQLNTYCSSTSHPLGKLVRALKDVIFESYAGIGASQYLLPHAIQDTKVFLTKLAEIVQKYAPFMIDEMAQLYGIIPKEMIRENSHLIDSFFISDLFLPRVYHTLFTLFSLLQEYNDSQYEIVVSILSRMNCSDLMNLFSISTPHPSDPNWFREPSQILSTITQEYTVEGKLNILQHSVNSMLENLKDCKTELCTDVIIPYFHIVIIYARVKKMSTELHYIYTFMDPKLSQGEFGFLLTLLEGCYMMLSPERIPCCL